MDGFKSLASKSLLVNDAKYWTLTEDKKATFVNNEINVEHSTHVYLTSINLSKYQYFHIEFEFFLIQQITEFNLALEIEIIL